MGGLADHALQVLGPDTVAPRAEIDHRQPPVGDEPIDLALADGEAGGDLGDGEEHGGWLSIKRAGGVADFCVGRPDSAHQVNQRAVIAIRQMAVFINGFLDR